VSWPRIEGGKERRLGWISSWCFPNSSEKGAADDNEGEKYLRQRSLRGQSYGAVTVLRRQLQTVELPSLQQTTAQRLNACRWLTRAQAG
jgi:hypothetical protein